MKKQLYQKHCMVVKFRYWKIIVKSRVNVAEISRRDRVRSKEIRKRYGFQRGLRGSSSPAVIWTYRKNGVRKVSENNLSSGCGGR